jgi:hypothetical protein
VLAKALAKAPEKRYASGRTLVEAAAQTFPARAVVSRARSRRARLLGASSLAVIVALAVSLPLALSGGGGGPTAKPILAVKTDSIQRFDPKTNKLVATIAVPVGFFLLAVGGGSVWAANTDENRLYRIDPKQNAVAQTIQTVQPAALAFGAGSLWVLDASGGVVNQFDPGNGAPTGTVRLPPGSAPGLPVIMRAGAEGVWVQWLGTAGNAVRIDPGSTAARPVTIGSPRLYASDFAPVGPILWSLAPDPKLPGTTSSGSICGSPKLPRRSSTRTSTSVTSLRTEAAHSWRSTNETECST